MDKAQKRRLAIIAREFGGIAILLGGSVLCYALFGLGIPCIFRMVTGLLCPGCGLTRAAVAILHGDLHGAMLHNALSLTLLPVLGLYVLYCAVRYVQNGTTRLALWEKLFLGACLAVVVWYFFHRNF